MGIFTTQGQNPNALNLGENGFEVVTDTSIHSKDAFCIYFYEQSVISAIVVNETGNTLVGETLPAGTIIYGQFESITLTSGACIMYLSLPQ